jgi:hypothetical protein
MPSFDELAHDYAERLARAPNPQLVAGQIAQEVRGLIYSTTQAPLSRAHRQQILQTSYEYLAGRPSYTKSLDNQQYLQLIEWIMSQAA